MAHYSQLPLDVQKYGESTVFTNTSVPKKLTSRHNTKAGVWGQIEVLFGQLKYIVADDPDNPIILTPEAHGIIAPEQYHYVEVIGPVEFKIAFYQSDKDKT